MIRYNQKETKEDKNMTEKENAKAKVTQHGFEVTEIGCTLQWTMANGKTCIQWFDENGNYVKTEWA